MSISSEAISAVIEVMNVVGKTVYYNRDTSSSYNVQTGEYNTASNMTQANGLGYADRYTTREIDGDTIQRGDQKLYAKLVSGYTPVVNDTVTMNNIIHRIMSVYGIEAENGTVVLYEIQLRQ